MDGLLDHSHAVNPNVGLRSYVDDLFQTQQSNSEQDIVDQIVTAAVQSCHGLEALEYVISSKIGFVASHASLRDELSTRFEAAAIPIKPLCAVRDLGTVTSASRRRVASKVQARRAFAYKKAKKVRYLCQLVGRASKLYKSGVLAIRSWGHRAIGLSSDHVQSMRAQAALSSSWRSPGACTTTMLSSVSAPKDDPQFRLRREHLMHFAQLWKDPSDKQRHGVAHT